MPISQLHPKVRPHWQADRQSPYYKRRNNKKIKKKLFKWLLILGLGGSVVLSLGVFIINRNLPDPEKINERQIPESTVIYDRTGEHVLFQLFDNIKRTRLSLEQIPQQIQHATLVAEDRDFYSHKGFKLTSFIRAAIFNIINLDPTSQGGSTITQQFVKNAILTPEKTYTRKIKELLLSYKIEKKFSKDEILNLYLNEIPYGSTAYGIEAASQTYFGKSVPELNLAEGSLLAALPKAPSFYSPYGNNKDKLIDRQKFILNIMVEEGYITETEAENAKNYELKFKPKLESITAPHFVFYLKEQLAETYGERFIEQGGLKIISTLDLEKQKLAESIITEYGEKNIKNFKAGNAALVSLDPTTGEILTMVGSRDYFDTDNDGNVNVATRPRQPGSSFKPIVYAAAFTKGFTPETKLFDVETTFLTDSGVNYNPKNYNLKENGLVSLRQALAGSLNIPAVKLIYLTGINNVLNLAQKIGYTTLNDRSRFGLSLVLGGGEVKLLEHASAFGAFAREGEWQQPVGVLKISDRDGRMIYEYKQKKGEQIIEKNVSRQINNILSDNNARAFTFGEKNYLTLPDREVAVKTGTTNDYIDAWAIGYTPLLVTGVWVGNTDGSAMSTGADGSQVAAPIWRAFMKEATQDMPKTSFTPPTTPIVSNPALRGEGIGKTEVVIDTVSGKLATEYTPSDKRITKTFFDSHSILFYINKDNPDGPAPTDPASDPQFANWEIAIKNWAEKNNYLIESPPTEYDNIHLPANMPIIKIISPQKNQEITTANLTLTTSFHAVNTANFVDYLIDGRIIVRNNLDPFTSAIDMNDFTNGWHTLTARLTDNVGSNGEDTITFLLNITHNQPGLLWIQPLNGGVATLADFPLTIKIKSPTPELIDSLVIKAKDTITNEEIIIASNPGLSDNAETEFIWPETSVHPANWQLLAVIKDRNGQIITKNGPTFLVNPAPEIAGKKE